MQLSIGDNVVLHSIGGTSKRLTGVYAIAPNDVYAVGDNGTMVHYDGSAWTPVNVGTSDDITDVWGVSSNLVYASAGHPGAVLIGVGAQVVTPEPASLLLISTGMAGVLMLTKKRRIFGRS